MGGLMDGRASSVAKRAKELDPGKAVKSGDPGGRCLKISLPAERQPGPDLGRRSGGGDHIDPGSAARSSGGMLLHAGHNMISGYPPHWTHAVGARGVPAAAAVADPQHRQRPDSPL